MKRIGYFLLAIILLTILVGGVSCQSKTAQHTATPEETISSYLDAWENLDVDKVTRLFVEEQREVMYRHFNKRWSQYKSVSLSEVEIEVISQTESTAKVKTCGIVLFTSKDGLSCEKTDFSGEKDLVKRNGEWLIELQ